MPPLDTSKARYRAYRADRRGADDKPAKGGDRSGRTDPSDRRRYLREYFRWLKPFQGRVIAVFGLALFGALLTMVLPLATRYIIDDILAAQGPSSADKTARLLTVCLVMIALMVVAETVQTTRAYLMAVLNAKVIFRLRRRLFDRFLRLPLSELSDLKTGGVTSRLSQDTDKVTGMVQMGLITPGVAAIRVVLTIAALLVISWQMAMLAGVLIPPVVFLNLMWIRRIRPIYRAMADTRSEIDGRITETIGGIRVVRAFRRERREERDYAVRHHAVIRQDLLAQKLHLVVSAGWGLLIPATTLAIVGFGGWRVIDGQGTIGDIVAFQMYAFMLMIPVSQIVNSYSATQQALAALERVFEILDKPDDKPDVPGAFEAPAPLQEVRFDGVDFEYREGLPVLHDITLTVPAGSTVALVGPSGGGKSTFVDLVARFHDPTRGAVFINGIDLRNIRLVSYRKWLAVVPQEVFLFDGTAAENVAYGGRGADRAAIEDAARRANAHEFITRLPEGYDTVVGERGVKLSGGQRQRISIARAILADPSILILDEATSSLDTESEQLIQASLAELFAERTTFVIAHRLSTISHADLIVVLDQGRIVQTGRHGELMAKPGLYRDMVVRQQRFATEPAAALDWD